MIETLKEFYNLISIIDLMYLVITIMSLIKCYSKGFVLSVLAMAKWLFAYIITLIIFPKVKPYFKDVIDNEYVLDIGLGIGLFIIVIFFVLLINKGISKAVKLSVLGRVDKIFGLFFGVLRTYIMFVFIFSAINSFFDYKHWPIDTEKSITFSFIQKGSNFLSDEIPDEDEYEDAKDKIQEL